MKNSVIQIENISKVFRFPVHSPAKSWVQNLLRPETKEIVAVNNISLDVAEGERIAFIGPNGAGKSTTIKMLTGILFPTSGTVKVLGFDPTKQRKQLAYQIGTVFGQRSQLFPNLPLTDSLEFYGTMYDMSKSDIKKRSEELIVLFDLHEFAGQPVRKLSLGQRMRGEIAASLIHRPRIIFLDEPTIGLDVVAKKSLRDLLITINKEENTTVFLTSHDVGDIESLCNRTVVINHGTVVKDLPTQELAKSFIVEKYIDLIPKIAFDQFPALPEGIRYEAKTPHVITVSVDITKLSVQHALKQLLDIFSIEDMDVYNADLESVIRHIYEGA